MRTTHTYVLLSASLDSRQLDRGVQPLIVELNEGI